ncbi:MAG TPA: right-handed parallel beta-helix repeat-containing protein, partial [Bacteroidales bacterium]|nr:right-handed parallel beta-helix repeat-containing protein [Bacteroidales bacterium]
MPFFFSWLTGLATTYYIKNGGSDLSNGLSVSTAWASVARINISMGLFRPGDSILFRKGDSWRNSTLVIRTAGIQGKNIYIGSYGSGEKPLIEGPENHPAIMVNAANSGFWTIDNIDLRAYGKISGVYNTVAIYHGYWLSDLGAVPGWIIQNCNFNCCLLLSGPGTIVRNNVFNGEGKPDNRGGAICFRGPECDNCIVELNTITDYFDRGVWIYNGGSNPIIRYNKINNIHKGSDHGGSGINIDGYGVRVTYGAVYNNAISDVDMSAITFENGYKALAYNNRTENCTGVMIWQYAPYLETGDIDIHHNLFHNGNNGVVIFNASGVHIANNTFVKNDDLGTEKTALYITTSSTYVSGISFVNNIVAGKWTHLIKVPDLKDIWTSFDYNILFPSRSWIMNRAGKNLSLSQVKTLGYMTNGNSLDPLFINGINDFHLQSRSPAINTGINLHYLSDIEDNAIDDLPDIGAFEYKGDHTIPLLLNCSVENPAPSVIEMNFNTTLAA